MENAAKALLIAGGMLLTMLILMLLIFFKGRVTEFYDEQDKIEESQKIAQFNKQFTNYERNNLYGYDIISVAHMVEDYNTRISNEGTNDQNYKPIILIINLPAEKKSVLENKIYYDNSYEHLFKKEKYVQSITKNEIVEIINEVRKTASKFKDEKTVIKVIKALKSFEVNNDQIQFLVDSDPDHIDTEKARKILQQKAVDDYNAITKENIATYNALKTKLSGVNLIRLKRYWEYDKFKTAVFKCTGVEYDNGADGTGRVSKMTFEFTGQVE